MKTSKQLGIEFEKTKAKLLKEYYKKVDQAWQLYRSKLKRLKNG
jgi:hypothetical protein